jgi:hypothetical protein
MVTRFVCGLYFPVVHTAVRKEHLPGDLVDVDPVGEAQWHAASLVGQHRRLAAARADAHPPLIRVGDVEAPEPVVEAQAQRPAAPALREFRRPGPGYGAGLKLYPRP